MEIKEQKLKTSELLAECKKLFSVWSYYSDEELDKQFPIPKILTEREFLDEIEPDAKTLGKSTKEADPDMKGMTFRERIIAELEYFKKTGQHLDIKGITFCSGSRYSGGSVPSARWGDGEFKVGWDGLDDYDSGCGIRSEVSLLPSSLLPLEKRVEELEKQMSAIKKFLVF